MGSPATPVFVIDTSSLVNFVRFYGFGGGETFEKLLKFFNEKISAGEIIVIDKVSEELKTSSEASSLRVGRPKGTAHLLDSVRALVAKHAIRKNYLPKDLSSDEAYFDKYENEFADVFLVAYCLEARKIGRSAVLVSDESGKSNDGKPVEKIPTICNREKLECINISKLLFDKYEGELKFSLEVLKQQGQDAI